jgi:Uma2 family endonuclease
MSATLVSLEEYLNTDYSPDREYVDGAIVERNLGKRPHSGTQSNFDRHLANRYPDLYVWPEQRLHTSPTRIRVPDVCVTLEDPGIDIFEAPPFICIEVLSPEDRISRVLEKLDEYVTLGVPHNWVVDPWRRKAFTYTSGRLEEVRGTEIKAAEISIPLSEVFDRL